MIAHVGCVGLLSKQDSKNSTSVEFSTDDVDLRSVEIKVTNK